METENKVIYDMFRKKLTNAHLITILTVSMIEIIGYIILIHWGIEKFAVNNKYLWLGVVVPIVINALSHIIARMVEKKSNRLRVKNAVFIAAAIVTSFVVAVFHKEYIVTCCAFVFPMIISAVFNDKKLLNASFYASLFIIFCVGIIFWLEKNMNLSTALNIVVLFGFAFISYLCGRISINFSNETYKTIEEQAKTNDKLQDDILRDQMTGLYNHTTFLRQLDVAVKSEGEGKGFCLVMIDVDNFKNINDEYGHDEGDEVLIFMAQLLNKYCKNSDTPYRYGGEEFAIIFNQKGIDEVYNTVKKILAEFSASKFSFTDSTFTFSAGIAEFFKGVTSEELFDFADDTLYLAKEQGRNRILISDCKATV